MTEEIYSLKPVFDNPKFRGLAFYDDSLLIYLKDVFDQDHWNTEHFRCNLQRFFYPGSSSRVRLWKPLQLSSVWKPLPVILGHKKALKNDYPCINLSIPAFSSNSLIYLQEILENSGELLTLDCEGVKFYAYNLTKIIDAIDYEKSLIQYYSKPRWEFDIESVVRLEFKPHLIKGLSIFRVYGRDLEYYVTSSFKKKVEENNLNGFSFKKVWPHTPKEYIDSDKKCLDYINACAKDKIIESPQLFSPAMLELWQRNQKMT
jgi:hypothetical protein